MQTVATDELAAQLRLAITRTARRLRQEAGGALSPSQTAALSTVERHGPLTPSELATRERIQRPTVTRLLGRGGRGPRARGPGPPPLLAGQHHARRPGAARPAAYAQGRLSGDAPRRAR